MGPALQNIVVIVASATAGATAVTGRSISAGAYSTVVVLPGSTEVTGWGHCDHAGVPGWLCGTYWGDREDELGANMPRLELPPATDVVSGVWFHCAWARGEPASRAVTCWGYCKATECITWRDTLGGLEPADALPIELVAEDDPDTVRDVQAGHRFACALLASGRVKCWGENTEGQLGLGDRRNRGSWVMGDMGAALPAVDLGDGVKAEAIAVGSDFACAVLEGGMAFKCWGGWSKALGYGDNKSRGGGPGEMGDALGALELGGRIETLAVGSLHACASLDAGRVLKCWGSSTSGQLGYGDAFSRSRASAALASVDLGPDARVERLAIGSAFTCAVLVGGELKCWGSNDFGQLGLGVTNETVGTTPSEVPARLKPVDFGTGKVVELAVGTKHTCVRVESPGAVRCWGDGSGAKLGRADLPAEDVVKWGTQPEHMGAGLRDVDLGVSWPVVPTASPNTATQSPTSGPTSESSMAPTSGPTSESSMAPTSGPTSESSSAGVKVSAAAGGDPSGETRGYDPLVVSFAAGSVALVIGAMTAFFVARRRWAAETPRTGNNKETIIP